MTFLNASGQYYPTWIVFFFTVFYSMMGHILLYFFEEKRRSLQIRSKKNPELTEEDVSDHSLLIKGIKRDVPVAQAQDLVESIFKELIPHELLKVYVIGDYILMNVLFRKLNKTIENKQFYKKLYEEDGKIERRERGILCWKEEGIELMHYYAAKEWKVKKLMNRDKQKKLISNYGAAFVILTSKNMRERIQIKFNEV